VVMGGPLFYILYFFTGNVRGVRSSPVARGGRDHVSNVSAVR
jgi:hypothetical protein